MQLKLEFDVNINPLLYREYSVYIFRRIKRTIKCYADKEKYRVRENLVLESSLIKWKVVPRTIDLVYYINHCLELVKINGVYIIRLNERLRLPRSFTKVSKLIRMLEFGTLEIPAYPLIRRVLNFYNKNYKSYFIEFMKERFVR